MSVNKVNIDGSLTTIADLIQVAALPIAGAAYLGKIYQYIGATSDPLVNGYFYKCISDGEQSPTYSWENVTLGQIIQVETMPTATADNSGAIVQYVGATNANYINGYFYKCVSDGGVTPAYSWEKIQVSDGGDTIQVETLPTASADELGNIYEFVGTTTANYINGRFYRCISDGASTPTYSWEEVQMNDDTPHWTGTLAEFNVAKANLADGTIVGLTDDIDQNYESGEYSTNEVNTGKRWIDGKPIYRRVFTRTIQSDGTGVVSGSIMYTDTLTGTERGFKGQIDFVSKNAIYLDTLVNVSGVIKAGNGQQWNIAPGIGQDETVSPGVNVYLLPRQANIYISLDGYLRFWFKDPQVVYNVAPIETYNIFCVIEYTKTTD